MKSFINQLITTIDEKDSCSVVGLDPQLEYIPLDIKKAAFRKRGDRLNNAARTVLDFNKQIINIIHKHVGIVKLQIAFYEMLGPWGLRAYSDTIKYAKKKTLIVIGDIKRGDVPHTAEAYANAHLGILKSNDSRENSFEVDAVTVNPFLGTDSVLPFIKLARKNGKGVFVLVKTSNPSSKEIQDLKCNNKTIYQTVANQVTKLGKDLIDKSGYSPIGAVVAPTNPRITNNLRSIMPNTYFLVPGFGAQRASLKNIAKCFNPNGYGAIVNSSRGITYAYNLSPWKEKYGTKHWECAVEEAVIRMNNDLKEVTGKIRKKKS